MSGDAAWDGGGWNCNPRRREEGREEEEEANAWQRGGMHVFDVLERGEWGVVTYFRYWMWDGVEVG